MRPISLPPTFLVDQEQWGTFTSIADFNSATVSGFAQSVGVAPGIIVGRLQNERLIGFNELNHLRISYEWGGISDIRLPDKFRSPLPRPAIRSGFGKLRPYPLLNRFEGGGVGVYAYPGAAQALGG